MTDLDETMGEIQEILERELDSLVVDDKNNGKSFSLWGETPAEIVRMHRKIIFEAIRQAAKIEAARILGEKVAEAIHQAEMHQKWTYNEHFAPNIEKALESISDEISLARGDGDGDETKDMRDSLTDIAESIEELGKHQARARPPKSKAPAGPSSLEELAKSVEPKGDEPKRSQVVTRKSLGGKNHV